MDGQNSGLIRGLALAACIPPLFLLLQLPVPAPFRAFGMARLVPTVPLPTTPAGLAFLARLMIIWLLIFLALVLIALPVSLVCRKLGFIGFWQVAAIGAATGLALAIWSLVTPYHPHFVEMLQRAGMSLSFQGAIDAGISFLQGLSIWLVIWGVGLRRELGAGSSERKAYPHAFTGVHLGRFALAAVALSALWFPILLLLPRHRDYIVGLGYPPWLFSADILLFLCVAGLSVALTFRRAIVCADRVRSIVLGIVLPYLCAFLFMLMHMGYRTLAVPGSDYRATPAIMYQAIEQTFLQFPIVALVGIGIQFALRRAGRASAPVVSPR
jgi:hypothetical protein